MLFKKRYLYFSMFLCLYCFGLATESSAQCDNIDLERTIESENKNIPDSTIFCLLERSLNVKDPGKLAGFLGDRHDISYTNSEYRTALRYVEYQAEIWNEIDSLAKYNKALFRQGLCHFRLGDMFESHRLVTQSIEHAKKIDDLYSYAVGHSRLAWIYARLDRYDEAISAIKIYKNCGPELFSNKNYLRYYHNAMSGFNSMIPEYEKARMHVDSAIQIVLEDGDLEDYATYISNKSNYYEGKDSLEKRLDLLRASLSINEKFENKINLSENYLNFGSLFLLQNEYDSSLFYLNKGLKLYDEIENKSRTHEALGILAEVYDSTGQFEKAYKAKRRQYKLDNELYGLTEVGELFDLEKELSIKKADEKIENLENEKIVKTLQLQRQRANLLTVALLFLGVVSLLLFNNYRNKQRRKITELIKAQQTHRDKVLLEKKALSAQMNPHFLFNSLNSIKSYIANREPRTATRYLNKFAQLMRITLSYSEEKLIPLSEEIKAVKLYIELEQFRLQDTFDYDFQVEANLLAKSIYVPPLIIQPFVENAIWHGLVKKEGAKKLKVAIASEKDRLVITISDNGIGRKASEIVKSKTHKSLGMKITRDRLALLDEESEVRYENVKLRDLANPDGSSAGTEVTLNLKTTININEKV